MDTEDREVIERAIAEIREMNERWRAEEQPSRLRELAGKSRRAYYGT